MNTACIVDPVYFDHQTGVGHPESPRRLMAIYDYLGRGERFAQVSLCSPQTYPKIEQWIGEVHPPPYYETLRTKIPVSGLSHLDPDTPMGPKSLSTASMAVSGVLTAIDGVMEGTFRNAFCAIRPPGHHAGHSRAMGFCLFNNVAIGARYLQKRHGVERVLIVDWDAHHGNGTQQIFYNDPTVFYFSTHQYPFYPGTGAESERGTGDGEGFTLNCPLEAGSDDRKVLSVMERHLASAVGAFRPDFILISAGFDAHRDDPLAGLLVTDKGFSEMTKLVHALATTYCHGRIISCLEGGYHLEALTKSVEAHLLVLSD